MYILNKPVRIALTGDGRLFVSEQRGTIARLANNVRRITYDNATVGDLDGDCVVGIQDFLGLLAAWGLCPSPPTECPADLDGDGSVGILDFLMLLANWS